MMPVNKTFKFLFAAVFSSWVSTCILSVSTWVSTCILSVSTEPVSTAILSPLIGLSSSRRRAALFSLSTRGLCPGSSPASSRVFRGGGGGGGVSGLACFLPVFGPTVLPEFGPTIDVTPEKSKFPFRGAEALFEYTWTFGAGVSSTGSSAAFMLLNGQFSRCVWIHRIVTLCLLGGSGSSCIS